jgi:hypothetical protein
VTLLARLFLADPGDDAVIVVAWDDPGWHTSAVSSSGQPH